MGGIVVLIIIVIVILALVLGRRYVHGIVNKVLVLLIVTADNNQV